MATIKTKQYSISLKRCTVSRRCTLGTYNLCTSEWFISTSLTCSLCTHHVLSQYVQLVCVCVWALICVWLYELIKFTLRSIAKCTQFRCDNIYSGCGWYNSFGLLFVNITPICSRQFYGLSLAPSLSSAHIQKVPALEFDSSFKSHIHARTFRDSEV